MDFLSAVNRISQLTRLHKKEVLGIYLFSALVQLSLPIGATMVTFIYVLILLVVLGVCEKII